MKSLIVVLAASALVSNSLRAQETATARDTGTQSADMAAYYAAPGDTSHPPADYVDVDKEPVVVKKVEPQYPALAKKAGMEGKVWVKVWVDKAGKPREVVVLKSDDNIFNEPAVQAARQFQFTPAMIKGEPVDVWVSVPFRFRLADKTVPHWAPSDTIRGPVPTVITDFVRTVLEGPVPDSARVSSLLSGGAQSVAGGYLKPLAQALEEQREGKQSIEQPGRKLMFFTYGMDDDGRSGYMVARTEKGGKGSTTHYHTIVFRQDSQGEWRIVHWHSWMGGR